MAERVQNAAFNNIKLIPNGTPKNGDGLLYIGENPLLVYSDENAGTDATVEGKTGWFLNQGGINQSPINSAAEPISDGVIPGGGLRQAVYPIETLRQLATSEVITNVKRTSNDIVKQTPNRHEQYTNMGVFVEIQSKLKTKQIIRKGDVVFAVDDTLFNHDDFAKLSNYVVGWNEVQGNVDNLPFLVYSGDHNSNTISYKYYNSANKTIFDLICEDYKCKNFNEDGYGTKKKPIVLIVFLIGTLVLFQILSIQNASCS